MKKNKIVYSLDTEDLQNVANEELERDLTQKELSLVESKIGDLIDWYEIVSNAITLCKIK